MLKLNNFVKRLFNFTAEDDYTSRGKALSHICFRDNELIAANRHILAIMDLSKNNDYHNNNVSQGDMLMSKKVLEGIFRAIKRGTKRKLQEINVEQTESTTIFTALGCAQNVISMSHPREDVYPTNIKALFPKKSALKAEINLNTTFLSHVKDLCEDSYVKNVHFKIYGETDPVVFEIENDTIPDVKGLIMPIKAE